jgi:DNA-binding PadR family transcriptional regulator
LSPGGERRTVGVVAAQPLCPLVLDLLAAEPRAAGDIARELARRGAGAGVPAHRAAAVTLRRLQCAGLVYRHRAPRAGAVFRLTARGRRELALQRGLRRALARV